LAIDLCRNRTLARPCALKGKCHAFAAAPRLSKSVHAANHAPRIRRDPSVEPRYRVVAVNRQTTADDEKRARLAAALRENLKRRKAQARARRAEEAPAQEPEPKAQAEPNRS
jgi:hypothetical protein